MARVIPLTAASAKASEPGCAETSEAGMAEVRAPGSPNYLRLKG